MHLYYWGHKWPMIVLKSMLPVISMWTWVHGEFTVSKEDEERDATNLGIECHLNEERQPLLYVQPTQILLPTSLTDIASQI